MPTFDDFLIKNTYDLHADSMRPAIPLEDILARLDTLRARVAARIEDRGQVVVPLR